MLIREMLCYRSPPGPYGVWHAQIDLNAAAVQMHLVLTHRSLIRSTIAWHPSPRLCSLYAIANSDGRVFLMNAQWQRPVRVLASEGMQLDGGYDRRRCSTPVPWSPDGGTLVLGTAPALPISNHGAVKFLRFGKL